MIVVPLFLFEVPGRNLLLVVQELQIGGTNYSRANLRQFWTTSAGWWLLPWPAELIAVFVADEGAQLTTYIE